MTTNFPDSRRSRALRAALAVTLGGLAACGSEPVDGPGDVGTDTVADTSGDVSPDVGTDTAHDVAPDVSVCVEVTDTVCPEGCTELNDGDCCNTFCGGEGWGYLANGDCSCAVEGPFSPPSFDRPRARPRHLRHLEAA
jgi:hypothetical protein